VKIILTAVVAIFISGCSSSPISIERATEAARTTESEYMSASEVRSEKVVIISDNIFGPSAIKPKIFVDGKEIGLLGQGEKMTVYLAPGTHQFGWSALTKGNYSEQEFLISQELKNIFHLVSPAGAVIRFVRERPNN
jgi:hypothetical protein